MSVIVCDVQLLCTRLSCFLRAIAWIFFFAVNFHIEIIFFFLHPFSFQTQRTNWNVPCTRSVTADLFPWFSFKIKIPLSQFTFVSLKMICFDLFCFGSICPTRFYLHMSFSDKTSRRIKRVRYKNKNQWFCHGFCA